MAYDSESLSIVYTEAVHPPPTGRWEKTEWGTSAGFLPSQQPFCLYSVGMNQSLGGTRGKGEKSWEVRFLCREPLSGGKAISVPEDLIKCILSKSRYHCASQWGSQGTATGQDGRLNSSCFPDPNCFGSKVDVNVNLEASQDRILKSHILFSHSFSVS